MESFYPWNPEHSHVLILAPNAHVSRLYYQQLRFYLLKMRYTHYPSNFPPLMGIALDLPSLHLNDSEPFIPPSMSSLDEMSRDDSEPVSANVRPHFLWEAPNTNAALYFGQTWVELHSFLSLRLARFHSEAKPHQRAKLVGDHLPAWSEYVLEFMRARGSSFFYPGSVSAADAFATIHSEVQRKPEEFHAPKEHQKRDDGPAQRFAAASSDGHDPNVQQPHIDASAAFIDPFLPPAEEASLLSRKKKLSPLLKQSTIPGTDRPFQPLINTLPFRGSEPSLFALPHFAWDGSLVAFEDVARRTAVEADDFRREIGGCRDVKTPEGQRRKIRPGSASDLFCFGDEAWEPKPSSVEEAGKADVAESAQATWYGEGKDVREQASDSEVSEDGGVEKPIVMRSDGGDDGNGGGGGDDGEQMEPVERTEPVQPRAKDVGKDGKPDPAS
jgi:hypothetical protein